MSPLTQTNFFLPLVQRLHDVVNRLPGAIVTFLICYIVIRILLYLVSGALQAARVNRAMAGIIRSGVAVVLWVGAVALVFQSLGLNQIAIALSGSVAVVTIGLASGANKLVSDMVAGLFLARNRDFKIGQRIKLEEVEGTIHSLDSRKVRVVGENGTLYIIPNTKFDELIWHILPDKEDGPKED